MERYQNKRVRLRTTQGRFRASSLESDFGLRLAPCLNLECRALNPYGRVNVSDDPRFVDLRWERPTACTRCGGTNLLGG